MKSVSTAKIITFLIIVIGSIGLFIFASFLNETEVKYVSDEAKGDKTVITCTFNAEREPSSSHQPDIQFKKGDVITVTTGQDIDWKKGDTMTVFYFGEPDKADDGYTVDAVHVTRHKTEE